ncbi:DoxX family protein [Kitasatospora azatica]|uniref:DoxX family protein n=1 Tax=Kitasatospora azatica TaxID=58347 RepID=UPI0009FEB2CF|nr:DoxX family protein [Kitasatospora azatica]
MIDAPPLTAAPYADSFGRPYSAFSYGGRPGLVRAGLADSGGRSAAGTSSGAARRKGRVTAVTWSGQAAPGDLAATQLLDAVRLNTVPSPAGATVGGGSSVGGSVGQPSVGQSSVGLADPEATQPMELPGWDSPPSGGGYGYGGPGRYGRGAAVPRQPHGGSGSGGSLGGPGSGSGSNADRPESRVRPVRPGWKPSGELPEHSAAAALAGESSRHAWYPGRRVDLGLVLLPLRLLLGSLSVYAGFSKLCDPVYFDGGNRGSMMRWLASLHPWKVAQPLLDFAMEHPVGAGLGVAFTEVVVGVLTLFGLWQRLAAGASMALYAVLLFTVSWRSVPVYDTPDLIFLAAWSPLLMAGAPFASLDGRLALEAWRRYGPQAPKAVRRRVLRRGTVVATVVIGLTLLTGSTLGAAVRTGGRPQPGGPQPSTDYGTPVWPATSSPGAPRTPGASAPATTPSASGSASPSAPPSPSAAAKSPKPHPSSSTRSGATDTTGGSSGQSGSSNAGTPTGSASTSAGSGSAPGSSPAGSGNRAPKPSPSSGLIGGVLGSGPPAAVQLPSLGMPLGGHRPSGAVV